MEQVKVNAIIPVEMRSLLHTMASEYKTTVQQIIWTLLAFGMKNMTAKEIRRVLAVYAKNSPTRKYQRTKPI